MFYERRFYFGRGRDCCTYIRGGAWLAAILIGLDKVFSIDLLNLLNISYDLILQKGA